MDPLTARRGQTARMDVVITSNKQQYELCDVQFYYSSSSAATAVVTGAAAGAIAGEWARYVSSIREAHSYIPLFYGGSVRRCAEGCTRG